MNSSQSRHGRAAGKTALQASGFVAAIVSVLCLCTGTLSAADLKITRGKWETLFQARRQVGQQPLPENSPVKNLLKLDLKGADTDPFHLGPFVINGEFSTENGLLTRTGGRNAAVELVSDVEGFELEGRIAAAGTGGWFWLLGWDQGHGYALYNPTLRTSGSPWIISEFRGDQGIKSTIVEINRWEWREPETLKMSVIDSRLNLAVGTSIIARDVELVNYHNGSLMMGRYDTPYGPRTVQVQSLRFRRVTVSGD